MIRLEWMEKTLDMLLAGMRAEAIRIELHAYLADKKQSGGTGVRGEKTYRIAIGPLMQSWVEPEEMLMPLRNETLDLARSLPCSERLPLHWIMISAAYPFWFQVALQTGRLLNLQEQATQKQIVTRLKEQYGDRQTISRYARYTIRSFVAWGVVLDTERKGTYRQAPPLLVSDPQLANLLLEATLHATPDGQGTLHTLLTLPAMFPFQLPALTGEMLTHISQRLDVTHTVGFDDKLLRLKSP